MKKFIYSEKCFTNSFILMILYGIIKVYNTVNLFRKYSAKFFFSVIYTYIHVYYIKGKINLNYSYYVSTGKISKHLNINQIMKIQLR